MTGGVEAGIETGVNGDISANFQTLL